MEDLTNIELILLAAAGLGIAIIGFVVGTVFGIERERLRHFRETFGHLVPRQALAPNPPPTTPRPAIKPKPQRPLMREGYQPVAPEGFSGPGKPPTGGSGAVRRFTTCHSCKGVGMIDHGTAENICGVCMGSGRVEIG